MNIPVILTKFPSCMSTTITSLDLCYQLKVNYTSLLMKTFSHFNVIFANFQAIMRKTWSLLMSLLWKEWIKVT